MTVADYTFTLDPTLAPAFAGLILAIAGWIRSHITVKQATSTIDTVNGDIANLRKELGLVAAKVDAAAQLAHTAADKVTVAADQTARDIGQVLAVGQANADKLDVIVPAIVPPATPTTGAPS